LSSLSPTTPLKVLPSSGSSAPHSTRRKTSYFGSRCTAPLRPKAFRPNVRFLA
jgi:hypothetical protein